MLVLLQGVCGFVVVFDVMALVTRSSSGEAPVELEVPSLPSSVD
jgi:hypothetical protein